MSYNEDMEYERVLTIKTQDNEERKIFLHAGKEVSAHVVDSFVELFRNDPSWLWNIVDYKAVQCPYNQYWYRIYEEDQWTFWVEQSPE